MLSAGVSCAQSRADRQLQFDLSKIGMVMDNRQICEDKGGLQDYPSKVMDQIIAAGPKGSADFDCNAFGRTDRTDTGADYLLLAGYDHRRYRILCLERFVFERGLDRDDDPRCWLE